MIWQLSDEEINILDEVTRIYKMNWYEFRQHLTLNEQDTVYDLEEGEVLALEDAIAMIEETTLADEKELLYEHFNEIKITILNNLFELADAKLKEDLK